MSNQITIPASAVGVTLTISDESLAEFERINDETLASSMDEPKSYWR